MCRFLFASVLTFFATTSIVTAQEPPSITVQWGVDVFSEMQANGHGERHEMATTLAFVFISVRDSWNFLVANNESCPVIESDDVISSYMSILTAVIQAPELIEAGALDHDLVPVLMVDIQGRMKDLGFDCRLS